jgi:hypothetical protein
MWDLLDQNALQRGASQPSSRMAHQAMAAQGISNQYLAQAQQMNFAQIFQDMQNQQTGNHVHFHNHIHFS